MDFFQRLLSLHGSPRPVEDFFTELVAHVFEHRPDVLREWLERIGVPVIADLAVAEVRTQTHYASLEESDPDSWLDLEIWLRDADGKGLVVFVESKIGSREGFRQLPRYAKQLERTTGDLLGRFLIYSTRDYDPKDTEYVLEGCPRVEFVPARWHALYAVLREHRSDNFIIGPLCSFMEEHGMAHDGMFSDHDLVAMKQMSHVLSTMEQALLGMVRERFQTVMGVSPGKHIDRSHFFEFRRVVLRAKLAQDWSFSLGFFLDDEAPQVGAVMAVSPEAGRQAEIRHAMSSVRDQDGWTGKNLYPRIWHPDDVWPSIWKKVPLEDVLAGREDHIAALETFFDDEILKHMDDMRQQFSDLPWPASGSTSNGFGEPEH